MTVWTAAVWCDVRGCGAKVHGELHTTSSGVAKAYSERQAREQGWTIDQQDGTDLHLCPEHKRHE